MTESTPSIRATRHQAWQRAITELRTARDLCPDHAGKADALIADAEEIAKAYWVRMAINPPLTGKQRREAGLALDGRIVRSMRAENESSLG